MTKRLLLPRERSLLRYAELWEEGDALLYVHSSRFSDRYARFRFQDIQALVLTEFPLWNRWRAWWLGVSAFLTLLLLLAPPGAWKLFAIVPGVFLVWAILYLARGPRCRLVLHTAVSTVTLEAVRTMAQARLAVPELRRLAEAAQGRLAPDGLTVLPAPAAAETAPPPRNTALLLQVLFGLAALHALLLALLIYAGKQEEGPALSALLLATEIVMAALAALRWRSAGAAMTAMAALMLALAAADGGVLLYTGLRSAGGIAAAIGAGRALSPDELSWLWLKEQTAIRAAWHAAAGAAGWALLLARGRRV